MIDRLGQVWRFTPNPEYTALLTPVERFTMAYERDEPYVVLNLVSGRTMPMNLHGIEGDPCWTRIA